jgi:hypothetical protein
VKCSLLTNRDPAVKPSQQKRKMQKAGLSPLFRRLNGSCSRRDLAPQQVVDLFFLMFGGDVGSRPIVPQNQKTRPGRYHVSPKSAMRSINFCQIPVKRKTLNVVDIFVPCLFVVVMLRARSYSQRRVFHGFSVSTLKERTGGEQVHFIFLLCKTLRPVLFLFQVSLDAGR